MRECVRAIRNSAVVGYELAREEEEEEEGVGILCDEQ